MKAYISFTATRAEARRLGDLLDMLRPVFQRHGGEVREVQGPTTGFHDPSFGDLVEMRLVAFPTQAHANAALVDPGYHLTDKNRSTFARLDVTVIGGTANG